MASEPAELREYLDVWSIADAPDGSAERIAIDHPECACEKASGKTGGYGPVDDEETLRYFVTSTSDVRLTADGQKRKLPNSAMFGRIYKSGMSVVRLDHAKNDELIETACIQHQNQIENDKVEDSDKRGGIVGVVDFKARQVRYKDETQERICCVYETPLDDRIAHADIVHASADLMGDSEEAQEGKLLARKLLFSQIAIQTAHKKVEDVEDCDLTPFLPICLKTG